MTTARGMHLTLSAFALFACRPPAASPPQATAREPLALSFAGPETAAVAPEPARAQCEPNQVLWRPELCRFASCSAGQFDLSTRDFADCERPLALDLSFEQNSAVLSVKQQGQLENLAVMAEALSTKALSITGHQSWDEKPDRAATVPLSQARANAVEGALKAVTQIAVQAIDGGTRLRRYVTGEEFERKAEVRMTPLGATEQRIARAPCSLPWTICDSEVTIKTEITVSTSDGDVVAELCRNAACSRGVFATSYYAVWPGSGGMTMKGDFQASLGLAPTEAQIARATMESLGKGTGPASFHLTLTFSDERIRTTDIFRVRLLRRRKDVALDWSGRLDFETIRRHPTRDVPACLHGTLAIPATQHTLR